MEEGRGRGRVWLKWNGIVLILFFILQSYFPIKYYMNSFNYNELGLLGITMQEILGETVNSNESFVNLDDDLRFKYFFEVQDERFSWRMFSKRSHYDTCDVKFFFANKTNVNLKQHFKQPWIELIALCRKSVISDMTQSLCDLLSKPQQQHTFITRQITYNDKISKSSVPIEKNQKIKCIRNQSYVIIIITTTIIINFLLHFLRHSSSCLRF